MGQARDEAGNIWETDAQGNPVRLLQAAPPSGPQPIVIGQPNPSSAYEAPKAAADLENTQNTIADRDADNRRADTKLAGELYAKGLRVGANGQIEPIPGWVKPGSNGAIDPKAKARAAKLRQLAEQIDRVERLYRDNLAGGWNNKISGRVPALLRPENEQFTAAAAAMAEQGLSAFRVPGVGAQSDAELRQFVEANRPLPTDTDLAIEEKLRAVRGRIASELQALDQPLPPGLSESLASNGTGTEGVSPSPSGAGFGATQSSIPVPPEMQAEYAAYMARNWGKLDARDLSEFVAGLEAKYDRGVGVPDYSAFVDRANAAAAEGAGPDVIGAIPATNRDMSELERLRNNAVSNPVGAFAATAFDAGGFGIPSLLTGDQMDTLREANPVATTAGDVVGGITGTILGGNALGAVSGKVASPFLSKVLANPLTADVVYGGTYGATQADDPLAGVGVGVISALVGDQVGKQIGKRLPGLVGLRKPGEQLSRGERAVFDAVGDVDEVAAALTQASELGVPATIADVSDGVNTLTGAALRRSPAAAAGARDMLGRRADGQYDRLLAAIERDLGPIENIPRRSEDLITQARTEAAPLYEAAYSAPGASVFEVADLAARPSMKKALNNAVRIAQEEGRDPAQIGFVFDEAGNATLTRQPSWQTLDYVKRGLDDVIEGYRDRTTGKLALDTEGKAVNDTLRELLSRMDTANPDYAAARAAYAGPAAEREAMRRGQEAFRISPDQLGVNVANASPSQVDQMRIGFRSKLAESAGGLRNNSNPFAKLNTPAMEQRLWALYPDADMEIARLLSQRDLEAQLAGSTNRLVGNSLTAERQLADEAFGQTNLAGDMVQGGLETLVTGAPVATTMRSTLGRGLGGWVRDARNLGFGRKAVELADEIAPIALDPNSAASAARLEAISAMDAEDAAILAELIEKAQQRGAHAGAGTSAVLAAQGVE